MAISVYIVVIWVVIPCSLL